MFGVNQQKNAADASPIVTLKFWMGGGNPESPHIHNFNFALTKWVMRLWSNTFGVESPRV